MNPKISIIMPVYNKARYLHTVLDQIQNQSFNDFECIIIDDGSTDCSADIMDAFAERDQRFKVIHKENGGVSLARNTGIDIASGDYITFIDADDEIKNCFLESLYTPAIATNADLIVGGCDKFWDDSDKIIERGCPFEGLVSIDKVFKSFAEVQYKSGLYGFCWNKLIPSGIVKNIRFNENIRLAEDLDFYLSVYPKIKNVYFLRERNYLYRQEAENSSVMIQDKDIDYFAQINIQHKMYKMLEDAGALTTNDKLVSNRIYDFVYCSIFHAPLNRITALCKSIKSLDLPVNADIDSGNFRKRWILKRFEKGSYKTIAKVLRCYRKLKGF